MDLFEVVNTHVVPSVHALMIEPFKSIWENDLTPDKSYAMKIFRYVELLCSPKRSNPFFGHEEEVRVYLVKKEVFGHPDTQIDTDIVFAVMRYRELLEISSPSYPLLISSLRAGGKLKKYLDEFNIDERTKGGAMVIKPKEIAAALKEIPDVVTRIEERLKNVNSELVVQGKMTKDRDPGPFEE